MRGRDGRGFTLIEILVVVLVIAIASGIAVANLEGDDRGRMEREARRLAGALEHAAALAQWQSETLGVSAEGGGYRFWRRGSNDKWIGARRRRRPRPARAAGRIHRYPCVLRRGSRPRKRGAAVSSQRTQRTVRPAALQLRMVRARRRRSAEPRAIRGASGFTLVEILVALAVLAVALTAGMRAVAQSADAATLLKQRTLALWVAQNRLAAAQLEAPWPALGRRDGERRAGERDVRLARDRIGHAEPGVSQDRDRRRRRRGARLRARAADRVPRQDGRAMMTPRAGFTLIELLIALAILALVATLGYRALARRSPTASRSSSPKAPTGAISMRYSHGSKPTPAPRCRVTRVPGQARSPRGSARSARPAMPNCASLAPAPNSRSKPGAPASASAIACAVARSKCFTGRISISPARPHRRRMRSPATSRGFA